MKTLNQQLSAECVAFVRMLAKMPCLFMDVDGLSCETQTEADKQIERDCGNDVPCWTCTARRLLRGKGKKP